MSLDSLSSGSHGGGVDDHISQLMQCKPLSEQQVTRFVAAMRRGVAFPTWVGRVRVVRSGDGSGSMVESKRLASW